MRARRARPPTAAAPAGPAAARTSPSRCGPGGPRTSRRTTPSSTSTRRPTRAPRSTSRPSRTPSTTRSSRPAWPGRAARTSCRCAPTASCSPPSPPGSLVPLDGTVDLSSWDANVVKSAKGKEDGKLYAVPLAQQTLQMFYNKDLFDKQGLKPPTTWAQFIEVNARLKENGITPMAVGAKDSWTLPIVHQVLAAPRFGGAAFEKAVMSGQKTFKDPDWVASVDQVDKLKPYLPDNAVGVAYTDAQILFTSGKAAMFPGRLLRARLLPEAEPVAEDGRLRGPGAGRLALDQADDHRLRRRRVRRLGQERRPGRQQGAGEVDVDQGVRPAGRGQGQAAVRRPGCHLRRPAAEADGRQLRQEPHPVPSARGLPLRHPLRHRRAGHRPAGAAAGQEERRPRSATSCRPASRSGSSRRRSPGCHDVPACSSWPRRCCCSGCSCSTRWCRR